MLKLTVLYAVFVISTLFYVADPQPPKVAVDVAVAATQAAHDDQPVLPDDFGTQTGIAATWSVVASSSDTLIPGVTLRTADDSFRCVPCEYQARILIEAGGMTKDGVPIWPFKILKTNQYAVPTWVPDGVDDKSDKILVGVREPVSLKKWIESYATKPSSNNSPEKWRVEVDGSDSRTIFLALAEALRRHEAAQSTPQGFLPAIPIDLNDDLLKVLDALLSKDGYTRNGFQVVWPLGAGEGGKRRMTFEPGIKVIVRKVVEADATVTAIEIDGRDVTLSLNGTFLSELTVRLK
jgi:hypothetical protein